MIVPLANPFRPAAKFVPLLLIPVIAAAPQAVRSQTAKPRTTPIPTSTTLTITSPTTMYYGQIVDGSAQVSSADGSNCTGTITFYDGQTSICVLAIAPAASCPASAGEGFAAGSHIVTAAYSGDTAHAASASSATTITVLPDTTTAQLTASPNPAMAGQSITITATIQGAHATPAGKATFYDGFTPLATSNLDATGTATFTNALTAGTHSLTAVYAATANFAPATSPTVSEQVQPPTPVGGSPYFTIAADSITVQAGQSAVVPVTISPANGFNQAVNLACSNLPEETTCSFTPASVASGSGKTNLVLTTSAPRDCGTTKPYGTANLPLVLPVAAGMLILLKPKRRLGLRGLLTLLVALGALAAMTGCGAGNCTDLGTRPGTYTVTVTGTSTGAATTVASQKITVKVTI